MQPYADALQKGTEARGRVHPAAQRERVGEEADHAAQRRRIAICHGRAEDHVLLARQPVHQRGDQGDGTGEGAGVARSRKLDQGGGQREAHNGAPAVALRRAGMVSGQVERFWQIGQRLPPPDLGGCRLGRALRGVPGGGFLEAERWREVCGVAGAFGGVDDCQFRLQHGHGPAIGDHMVTIDDQCRLIRRHAQQPRSQQRACEVEAVCRFCRACRVDLRRRGDVLHG